MFLVRRVLKAGLDTQIILRGATAASPTVTAKIYELICRELGALLSFDLLG